MRLAYIDHRLYDKVTFSDQMIDYAKKNNIVLNSAESFEEFKEKHGILTEYDGLIIHPGHKNGPALEKFVMDHPTMPVVIVAAGVMEYIDDFTGLRVIDYLQKDQLFHFSNYRSA